MSAKKKHNTEDLEGSDIGITLPDFGNIDIPDIDLDIFDYTPDAVADTESRYVKPRYVPIHEDQVMYDNAVKLAREIRLDFGERYDVLVSGAFVFGDFIEAFMTTHMARAKKMTISSLSISQENIDSLHTLMSKGYIDRLDLIVSTYFYNMERRALIPYMLERLDIDNKFQLAVANIHTKTWQIETLGGRKIVMHGSANLRSSGSIEQFTIEENPEVYDFYDQRLGTVVEKCATINKAVSVKNLWKEINRFHPKN